MRPIQLRIDGSPAITPPQGRRAIGGGAPTARKRGVAGGKRGPGCGGWEWRRGRARDSCGDLVVGMGWRGRRVRRRGRRGADESGRAKRPRPAPTFLLPACSWRQRATNSQKAKMPRCSTAQRVRVACSRTLACMYMQLISKIYRKYNYTSIISKL